VTIEKIYSEAIKRINDLLQDAGGIALGFHSVVDGLVERSTPLFRELMEKSSINVPDEPPLSISSREDFLKGFLYSFSEGKALQLMIDSQEVKEWIESIFGSGVKKLGGTSANMALALSHFGFRDVLVYIYPQVKDLSSLFPKLENLWTIDMNGNLSRPWEVNFGKRLDAIHWIFEFKEGESLKVDGVEIVCPRSNRYIASWNPVNSKLKVSETFKEVFPNLSERYGKFIIAGFHIMRDEYPDGETVEERMEELAEFLKLLKQRGVKIHIELASIRRNRVRRALLETVMKHADSVGMNEMELFWTAGDMDVSDEKIKKGEAVAVEKAIQKLMERTGVGRVHFHTLGYYMLVKEGADGELLGLASAALAAAYLAHTGRRPHFKDLEKVLNLPVVKENLFRVEKDAVILPTKISPNPKRTVGLGDTISSIAFALSDIS